MYTFTHDGARVLVDVRGQVLLAEIEPRMGFSQFSREPPPAAETPPYDASSIRVLDASETWPATLHPTVASAGIGADFTPLFALTAKAKRFDDRLVSWLERLYHHGAGEHDGLFAILTRVREGLAAGSTARGLLDAAAHLGERTAADLSARKWIARFRRDAIRSRPIGMYAENEELQRFFLHDRILQSKLAAEDATAVRGLLDAEPEYRRLLRIISRVTGPFVESPDFSVLPPSESAEGRLVKALFGNRPIPPDFELGRELVTRIRDGRLDTRPRTEGGWYAHQFHAIAALLAPDTEGLQVGPLYRTELEDYFKAMFAVQRETHVKQLEIPVAGGRSPLFVRPRVSVEPLPELYARMSSAYRFLREQLTELVGEHVLRSAEVFDGLVEMELLFRGAEVVSRVELGQEAEDVVARAFFGSWQRSSESDPDLDQDLRIAVPVWEDEARGTVHVCATIGIETRNLKLEFETPPRVQVIGDRAKPIYTSAQHTIVSPITIECDMRKPPTRSELRAICDQEKTPAAIKTALERS